VQAAADGPKAQNPTKTAKNGIREKMVRKNTTRASNP
jgi:hypothetical protein